MDVFQQNCVSFFDFAAETLCQLKKISSDHFYKLKSIDSLPTPENMNENIEAIIKQLRQNAPEKENGLSSQLVRVGLPPFFIDWVHKWNLNNQFKPVYELLHRLSREIQIKDLIDYFCEDSGFESLNQNVDTTGIVILPRVPAMNQSSIPEETVTIEGKDKELNKKKPEYTWADSRMHLQFNHFFYYEKKHLTTKSGRKFHVKNYIIKNTSHKTCIDQLSVAVSPISRGDFLNFRVEKIPCAQEERVYTITKLSNDELIHRRIESAFLSACQARADILMFPEMLGDEQTFNESFWDSLSELANEKGLLKKPSLVFPPTWWHANKNEMCVFDEGGAKLFQQQKQYPFDGDIPCGKYTLAAEDILKPGERFIHATEDIRDPDSVIHILHIEDIGRVMIPICKDFLIKEYTDILLGTLQATLLLIPSYSTGSTQFVLSHLEAPQFGCYVIWLNTCAALWQDEHSPDYIGIATSPFLKPNGDWICQFKPECNGYCGGDAACLFIITIDLGNTRQINCKHNAYPKS